MNARVTAAQMVDDAVNGRGGADALIKRLTHWPALDPLPEATESTPQAFPFHGLGKMLGEAARSIAEGVQAPDALAGGSVLASAALAAQAHADIVMPHGQRAPLSVFVVTGALSGDRKTATDAVASLPAEEHRREQAREHAAAIAQYEQGRAARQKGDPVGKRHRGRPVHDE